MDLLQLRYFQTVARPENVTHAAEELHIAQPCISRAIARLEDSVGVALFERTGKRIRLNEFGRVFLKRVERCFNELEEGQRELADLAGAKRGKIVVGATIARILPGLFGEFLKTRQRYSFSFFRPPASRTFKNAFWAVKLICVLPRSPSNCPKYTTSLCFPRKSFSPSERGTAGKEEERSARRNLRRTAHRFCGGMPSL
jgi:hypothetical protein